jgi:hypothetical protein
MKYWLLGIAVTSALALQSPYADQTTRGIKALSDEDVAGYLAGDGMGFAKAAELNRYPGPKHVLELAQELTLSEQQVADIQALFETMQGEAQALGARLVALEGELDESFATRVIDAAALASHLDELGEVQARLRFVHLVAHLHTTELLTDAQISIYDRERGYGSHADHSMHQGSAR